jgi:predicted nucleic acid-binding protein
MISMISRGELVVIDTNILLTATDRSRRDHETARSLFRKALSGGIHLALTGQIVREYLVVTTRPIELNGLGLSVKDALHNIEQFTRRTVLLEETEDVNTTLLELVRLYTIIGKGIHYANIAATMIAHGVSHLVTHNSSDFTRFREIRCLAPGEFSPG